MFKKLFSLAYILLLSVSVCSAITIIPQGSTWKYSDNGVDLLTAWRDSVFNDAGWSSGNAQLGYGEGDEATVISYGGNPSNKYPTYYFRKKVNISNLASLVSFTFNLKRDDGAVVYVNGNEVWRNNMPAGTINYSTLAGGDALDDGQTFQSISAGTNFFVNGDNYIAVEVHQVLVTSSDVSFDFELIGNLPSVPVLTRGPYLQMPSTAAITLRWRTDIACATRVEYGLSAGSLTNNVTNNTPVTEHIITISGLNPNTQYFYNIGDGTTVLQGTTTNYFFTSPVIGTVKKSRIWIMGDTGVNTTQQNQVRDAYITYNGSTRTDMMVMLGDNAYNSGTDAEYQAALFQNHYENQLKNIPLWVATGNHEMYTANAAAQTGPYYDIFSLPSNGECGGVPSGTEAYYSFNYANIHFVCLESTTASFRANGSAQMQWLQNDLSANTQKFLVIYFHHPPYSMGNHNSDNETELYEMRQNYNPIFEQYKADLILSGHGHSYERSFLLNGYYGNSSALLPAHIVSNQSGAMPSPFVKNSSNGYAGTVYVQAGNAGVLETVQTTWPHPAMYAANNLSLGSLVLDVNGDTLTLSFINNNTSSPSVLDNFTIIRQCNLSASITPVPNKCTNSVSVALSATPAGGTFSGSGVTGNTFNPSIAGSGTHTISYTYSDGFCTTVATTNIVVNQAPQIVSASGSNSFCAGLNITLNATAGVGYTYQWYRNGVVQVGSTASTFTTANTGTYYCIIGNAPCSGNSNSLVVSSINNPTPVVSYTSPLSFCAPGSVQLSSNTFAGATYQWQKNSIDIPGATSSVYTASATGSYRVKQTANGCFKFAPATSVSSAATSVLASISANGSTTFCSGGSVQLVVNNPIPGYSFQWKNNGVNIAGANSTTYSVTTAGSYTCQVAASCGSATSNAIVVSTGSINASISPLGTVTICTGTSVNFNANTGSGYTYQWKLDGIDISGATSQNYSATIAGNYSVFINSACGSATSPSTSVTISSVSASVNPSGTNTICAGTNMTFNANTGYNYTYQWYRNGGLINGATSSTYLTSNYGNYTVKVTQGGVCSATSSASVLNVTNNPTPVIAPGTTTTICSGQSVNFSTNTFAGVFYQWQKNGMDIAGATNQNYNATTAGTYRVKQSANGCFKYTPATSVIINCRLSAHSSVVTSVDVTENQLVLHPNPFNESAELYIPDDLISVDLVIYINDILGNHVRKYMPGARNKLIIEKGNLAPGVYFMTALSGNAKITVRKIIIQ